MSAEPDEYTAEPDGEVQDGAGGDGADVNNAQAFAVCEPKLRLKWSTDRTADLQELEAMKARLRAMEEESKKLQEAQAKISRDAGDPAATAAAEAADREEADARSIYIGNVDYACTPEELQQHFQQCGTVNRVTILTDKMGNAKGYAYLEFLEVDAVNSALLLDGSELHNRQIKVTAKRTNVPGMKQRGRGRGRIPRGGGFRGGYGGYGGYGGGYGGFGYPPRGRGRGRGGFYSPY